MKPGIRWTHPISLVGYPSENRKIGTSSQVGFDMTYKSIANKAPTKFNMNILSTIHG
jgi:hypothetical protein